MDSKTEIQLTQLTHAINRIADAINVLAEVYYQCNAPAEDDVQPREGQSLSDREHL